MPGLSLFEPSCAVAAELLISVRTKIPLGVFRAAAPDNLGTFSVQTQEVPWARWLSKSFSSSQFSK